MYILIFLFIFGSFFTDFCYSGAFHYSMAMVNTYHQTYIATHNLHGRMKRDDKPRDCSFGCLHRMGEFLKKNAPDLVKFAQHAEKENPDALITLPQEDYKNFCKNIIAPFFICVDACPDTMERKALNLAFISARFICVIHFDEIYEAYDCLQEAMNATKMNCESDACDDEAEGAVAFVKESKYLIQTGNQTRFKKLIADACAYVTCTMDCEVPTVEEVCEGNNMSSLIENDLVGISMRSNRDILYMSGRRDWWPDECTDLLDSTGFNTPFNSELTLTSSCPNIIHNSNLVLFIVTFLVCLFVDFF